MSEKAVLVADDDCFIRRALIFILEKNGYRVFSAADGEEALAAILSFRPPVVILDVMMPKMNGYEVCAAVRARPELEAVQIFLLTALDQEKERGRGLEAGARELLTKPFRPADILQRVKELLP